MNTTELNLSPTCPRLAIFSLRELHQTSPSALRAETSFRYQSDPLENHTDEAGASLACYQSILISGTSFFSQWYFPSSGRSTNEILREIVASSPFLYPSRLSRSLARSHETRLTRPSRRACSQARQKSPLLLGRKKLALGSKPPLDTQIARTGLGTRLVSTVFSAILRTEKLVKVRFTAGFNYGNHEQSKS